MFAFVVFVSVFQYRAERLAGRNVSEMTDVCRVWRKTLTRSIQVGSPYADTGVKIYLLTCVDVQGRARVLRSRAKAAPWRYSVPTIRGSASCEPTTVDSARQCATMAETWKAGTSSVCRHGRFASSPTCTCPRLSRYLTGPPTHSIGGPD